MKKTIYLVFALCLLLIFSSFQLHKFYVSIYQINFDSKKKMLQITSHIFIDDLNASLSNNFKKKVHVAENNETEQDVVLMQNYLSEHFLIKVNGQKKEFNFLSKETEGNVLICYFNCKPIPKIKTLEIQNTALFDLNPEQQNIIQTTIDGKKQSLLLTEATISGIIK